MARGGALSYDRARMGFGLRAVVPLVALAAGTWMGMGRPDATALQGYARRAAFQVAGDKAKALGIQPPPQGDRPPPVDPSRLPEPRAWPELNPEGTASRAWLLAEGPAYAPDDPHRYVTFTFDDGPFPETTPKVLELLARYRVRATFFFIGRYLEGDDRRAEETRDAATRIAAAGHFIGNHTYSHPHLPQLPRLKALAQIDDAAAAIERATGKRPTLFRPPFGETDPFLEQAVKDRGLSLWLWSVAVDEMKMTDSEKIAEALKARIEFAGGGTILLHDMRWPSVHALERLLRWLSAHAYDPKKPKRRGYEIVDIVEYMKQTARAPQPFTSRQQLEEHRRAAWGRKAPRAGLPPTPTPPATLLDDGGI